jgi:hypothetical protein
MPAMADQPFEPICCNDSLRTLLGQTLTIKVSIGNCGDGMHTRFMCFTVMEEYLKLVKYIKV